MATVNVEGSRFIKEYREVWFTNMLVLGFDPAATEDKLKVTFQKDMFVHINKKGSEIVLHFLFSRLNSHLAYEEFRDCWPIYDKKQELHFRKACSNWLARIAKEDPESKLPRLSSSLLLSPGGDKYYIFLLRFSAYVLKTVVLREGKAEEKEVFISSFIQSSSLPPAHRDVSISAIKAHIVKNNQQVVDRMQQVADLHKEWETYSSQLVTEYRSTSKTIKELKNQLHTLQEEHKQRAVPSTPERILSRSVAEEKVRTLSVEVTAKQRAARMEKARKLWKTLESFEDKIVHQMEVVDSILQGQANKYTVDAKHMDFQIPEMLVHQYESLVQSGKAGNTYQAGKLNLISLVQLWNCSLKELVNQISTNDLPSFEEEGDYMKEKLQTHRTHLAAVNDLRTCLSELLSSLQLGIERAEKALKEIKDSSLVSGDSVPGSTTVMGQPPVLVIPPLIVPSLGFDLLPPSPETSMLYPPNSTSPTHLSHLSFLQDGGMSTPEAVQSISRSVHTASRPSHTVTRTADVSAHAKVSRLPVTSGKTVPKQNPAVRKLHGKRTQLPLKVRDSNTFDDSSKNVLKATIGSPAVSKSVVEATFNSSTVTTTLTRVSSTTPTVCASLTGFSSTTPTVSPSVSNSVRVMPLVKPSAQDILADQIAEAVASQSGHSTPHDSSPPVTPNFELHSVTNTLSALSKDAFISKDVIPRTPLSKTSYRKKASGTKLYPVVQSPLVEQSRQRSRQSMEGSSSSPPRTTHPMAWFQPNLSMYSPTKSVASPEITESSVWSNKCSSGIITTTPKTSVSLSSFTPSLYHQFSPSHFTGEVSSSPAGPGSPLLTAVDEQLLEDSLDQFTDEKNTSLPKQNTIQHTNGDSENSDLESAASPEIAKPSSKVVWSHTSSSGIATTPVSVTSLTPTLYQQQSQYSPVNQAFTTPSRLTQSQPLVEITPDLTPYSAARTNTHALISPVVQPPMALVGSIEANDRLHLSKLCTPTTSPLQYPSMFKTPTDSTGLLSAIEPPTPFQHADFDLDSSFSDVELQDDKEGDLLLSLSSNSSHEPTDPRNHSPSQTHSHYSSPGYSPANLFKGQSPVVGLQTHVAVGQLLDLEEFN